MTIIKNVAKAMCKVGLWILAGAGFCSGLALLLIYVALFVAGHMLRYAFEATVGLLIQACILGWMCGQTIPERVEERVYDCRMAFKYGNYKRGCVNMLLVLIPGFSVNDYAEFCQDCLKEQYRSACKNEPTYKSPVLERESCKISRPFE